MRSVFCLVCVELAVAQRIQSCKDESRNING